MNVNQKSKTKDHFNVNGFIRICAIDKKKQNFMYCMHGFFYLFYSKNILFNNLKDTTVKLADYHFHLI